MTPNRRDLLAGLAVLPMGWASERDTPAGGAEEQFDTLLKEVFETHQPVGLAAAIVTPEGLNWSGARGLRRHGHPSAVARTDVWHLGSNTKAMTAAVLARLIDSGRARWALPLSEAFPGTEIHPGWADVTLDDFMRHRAGLTDASTMGLDWLLTARADPRNLPDQRADIVSRALSAPPSGERGRFAYGNANYVVVGAAIERLVGDSWENAMRAELFRPLGMKTAGFGAPSAGSGGDANAWGHRLVGDRRLPMAPDHPGADNPPALGPAGTAHMSLEDYGRFLSAMMGGAPGWLSQESLERLATPAPGPGPAYACGWGVASRPWGGPAGPAPALAHDGSNTMWHCSAVVAPERSIAFIAVANEAAAGARACQAMVGRLAQALPSGPVSAR